MAHNSKAMGNIKAMGNNSRGLITHMGNKRNMEIKEAQVMQAQIRVKAQVKTLIPFCSMEITSSRKRNMDINSRAVNKLVTMEISM
jgi:hypothetical protein